MPATVSQITKGRGAGSIVAPGINLSTAYYALPQSATVPQETAYKIASGPERAGAAMTVAFDAGATPDDGHVTWLIDGVAQSTIGYQAAFTPSGGGMMAGQVVTAEFLIGGAAQQTVPMALLMTHQMASHNVDDDAVMGLVPHAAAMVTAVADGGWSDPTIWDTGTVPDLHDRVLIPMGRDVTYDSVIAPRLDWVRIDGVLRWALDRSTNMLVEHLVVSPVGHMIIGEDVDNALPAAFDAKITISNRGIQIDPDSPTDLDLTIDPRLIGRGLLVLGAITVFGHHRETFLDTAPGSLPIAGDTSLTLDHVPLNWAVGDTLIVPGTVYDTDQGVTLSQDEERVITAISGNVVSFATPLVYDHDHHNPSVTDRPDLTLPIAIKGRNITFCSEDADTIAVHRRGHTMFMHMRARVDVWDAAFIGLGRTDKSIPAGVILADGVTVNFPARSGKTTYAEPLTATSNLQSRYPVHGHFLGFDKPVTDLVRDCYVEDAKAWAMVHHGCRMDWKNNVMRRFQGAGLVAESANELGRWDNCLAFGMESTVASSRFPKGAEEENGKRGDFAFTGYGFFYRGRAMVVTRNVAIGCSWGHTFYHRWSGNGIADQRKPLRKDLDVHDLAWMNRDNDDELNAVDYPITHFDKCRSIGCFGAVAVVKEGAKQDHDLNIKISNFLGWGIWNGIELNYIGGYLVQDVDLISTTYSGAEGQAVAADRNGIGTGKTNQVAVYRVTTRGFYTGVKFSGISVQGIANSDFSQADPRFMLKEHTSIDNTIALDYSSSAGTLTQDVTWIAPGGHTDIAEPSVTWLNDAVVIGTFNGGSTISNIEQPAIKTDSVSNGGVLPKPWDNAGLLIGNSYFRLRNIASGYGYYTHNGEAHLAIPFYFSDRLTARSIKQTRLVRYTGSLSGKPDLGLLERSTTPPTAADFTVDVVAGQSVTFNALTLSGAAGEAGTTLTLGDPHMTAFIHTGSALGDGSLASPAHFKPNYGSVSILGSGETTYKALEDYSGTDAMLVYVYDGKGRWVTVEITFNVTEA